MKNLQTRVVTDLAIEPVTLAEAKNYCKVTGTQDDDLITLLITSARKALEKYTSSSFGEKTMHVTWVKPPDDDEYEIPYGPHISIDAVYRIDAEGTETALTVNSDYWVYGSQDFILKVNRYWSSRGEYSEMSYRVEYTAGYGNTATEPLPDALKLAILKQVSTDYLMRENLSDATMSVLDNSARNLAAPYRKMVWF